MQDRGLINTDVIRTSTLSKAAHTMSRLSKNGSPNMFSVSGATLFSNATAWNDKKSYVGKS